MKNIALAIILLITISGCALIKDIETISDHVDDTTNPNSQGYNGFRQYRKSIYESENLNKIPKLIEKRKFAIDITLDALELQGRSIEKADSKEKIQEIAAKYLSKAVNATKEYRTSAEKYNCNKEASKADKVLVVLNQAKEYQKLDKYKITENKLKYAVLLLTNNKTALWLWQNRDNQTFPDYLKWGDSTIKNSNTIVKNPDSLAFSGGGVKGTAYIGILKYMEESGKLSNVKRFVGTSAGTIMCTFMSISSYYNDNRQPGSKNFHEIVYDLMMRNKFIDFIDNPKLKKAILNDSFKPFTKNIIHSAASVSKMLDNQYALCNGNNLSNFLKKALKEFGLTENITLEELYKLTGKRLVLVSCSLSYRKAAYFDYRSAPDLKVVDAVRASMAIPFIFKPVKYNNDFFVDGGAVNNFPINYFDESLAGENIKPATLGFILYSKNEILRPEWRMLKNPADYTSAVSDLVMINTGSALFKKNVDRTVFIDCGKINVMSFNITKAEKIKIIQAGYNSVKKYFNPNFDIKSNKTDTNLIAEKNKESTSTKTELKDKENKSALSWYIFYPEIIFLTPQLKNVYGLCLGIPMSNTNNVYGINLGAMGCKNHNAYGLQLSPFFNNSKNITGISAAFVNNTKSVSGILLALYNNVNCKSNSYTLLIGGLNNTNNNSNFNGLQIAILNNINNESNSNSIQFGVINNINLKFNLLDKTNLNSAQIGVINNTNSDSNSFTGFQAGLFNRADYINGVQIGLYNIANYSSGIQFGLINKMENAWIPYMPFINFSF
jgi:NTE family protein